MADRLDLGAESGNVQIEDSDVVTIRLLSWVLLVRDEHLLFIHRMEAQDTDMPRTLEESTHVQPLDFIPVATKSHPTKHF